MARTKMTKRPITGGSAPRMQLAQKAPRKVAPGLTKPKSPVEYSPSSRKFDLESPVFYPSSPSKYDFESQKLVPSSPSKNRPDFVPSSPKYSCSSPKHTPDSPKYNPKISEWERDDDVDVQKVTSGIVSPKKSQKSFKETFTSPKYVAPDQLKSKSPTHVPDSPKYEPEKFGGVSNKKPKSDCDDDDDDDVVEITKEEYSKGITGKKRKRDGDGDDENVSKKMKID